MKITQKERDALFGQLMLLYRDLPSSFRTVQEQDLKHRLVIAEVLCGLNGAEPYKNPTVELTVLKFAVLAILYEKIALLAEKDQEIDPIAETVIETTLRDEYHNLNSMLLKSEKSPTEILAQHRNPVSKLFCQSGLPRSLSLFGDWITKTKTTKGTALDPEDFTSPHQGSDDDFHP